MGPRKIVEIEGRKAGIAESDAGAFDTQKYEDRPEDVEKDRGRDQGGQRAARGEFLGGEPDGEVAYEHDDEEVMTERRDHVKKNPDRAR